MMLFLTKSSSASRRSLLALLLALCFLSCALGAKITKKAEQPPADDDNKADKAEQAAAAAAATSAAPAVEENDDDDEEEADEDDDDDDDDDDDEEEVEKEKETEQQQPQKKKKKQKKPADKDATAATADKNELQPAVDPTDLSVWGMVRTLWGWLRSDLSESLFGDADGDGDDDEKPAAVEGRTFGKIRRLQMALIPIIFKFGVLSAMVAFLVAIGMKSLFLLKVLVVMNALAILGKFLTLKTSLFGQYENSAPSFSYPGWNPHAKESWGPTGLSNSPPSAAHPPSKEIHLHIHGNAQTQAQLAGQGYNYETSNGWASRSDPYGAYLPTGQYQEVQRTAEVPNNTDPMALLPTKYPARSLIR